MARIPKKRGPVKAKKAAKSKKTNVRSSAVKKQLRAVEAQLNAAKSPAEYKALLKRLKAEALADLKLAKEEARARKKARAEQLKAEKAAEKHRAKVSQWFHKTFDNSAKLRTREGDREPMSRHIASELFPSDSDAKDADGFVDLKKRRKLTRREAAIAGWIVRKTKQFQASGVSLFGARDWAILSKPRADALERLTQDVIGVWAWTHGKQRVDFVRRRLEDEDEKFMLYMKLAHEMGYTTRQARTALFSPRAKPSVN